jgi:hypothetical protein
MSVIDQQNMMSDGQLVTASAASTSYIDTGVKGDALDGSENYLVVRCKAVVGSSGHAATIIVALQSDSDPAFGTVVSNFISATFAEAVVVAGYVLVKMKLPVGLKRYIRVYYTIGTENLTAGSFDAYLTPGVDVGLDS